MAPPTNTDINSESEETPTRAYETDADFEAWRQARNEKARQRKPITLTEKGR